ncbi:MAG TPA: PQQ-dependent sugar dehydrogenase, partial [Aquaticitalea sp.]|nr:PQQ-dependent sugar dehydrogenase [Aquaticitalea sp.]
MKKFFTIISFLSVATLFSQSIGIETFATGFNNPVAIANAGDGNLFIVERRGVIQIVDENGDRNDTPFLNIDPLVASGGEYGLLGLAFHPNYAENGYFYVNYSNNQGNNVISRFTRSTTDDEIADPDSELHLLTIEQPYNNHNGGDIAFGPDGYLYIASGDGGSGGDPGD